MLASSTSQGCSLIVDQRNFQAFVDLAFVLCFDNANATDFFSMVDVRAAVGLQVQPDNFHNSYFFHIRRQHIDFGAYQVWYGESLLSWERIDFDWIIRFDRFVYFLLNIGHTLFIQVLHREIHASFFWVHLPARYLHSKLAPDDAA